VEIFGKAPWVFLFEGLHLTSKKISSLFLKLGKALLFDLKKTSDFPRIAVPELNKKSVNFIWFSYKQVQYVDNSLKIYQQSKNIMLFEHIAGFISPFVQTLTKPVD